MSWDQLQWGALHWLGPVLGIAVAALILLLLGYWRAPASHTVRGFAFIFKSAGIALLLICLLEPLLHSVRPRPGANLFVLLADNSQSLGIRDSKNQPSRGEDLKRRLTAESRWNGRLSQDFDVRHYQFDTRLRAVDDFSELSFQGHGSALFSTLQRVGDRYRGRPMAGVLVFTDGNATDLPPEDIDWGSLPPIFPVLVGRDRGIPDVRLGQVTVSRSNFEETPVTIQANVEAIGTGNQPLIAQLLDEQGKEVDRLTLQPNENGQPLSCRFQFQPETHGVSFYRVRVIAEMELAAWDNPSSSSEATLVNNSRHIAVEQDQGPYRVLYVAGRPNWEYKFLRRAIQEDREVELVALIRIAKREAKFDFRRKGDTRVNRFFEGSMQESDEEAERYDKPVLLRIDTLDGAELRDGFPVAADQLFSYDAVILDDLESEYFTQDQMTLLNRFVSQRGGGLLMLGGQESFIQGKYYRTPLGELLPVYLDGSPGSRPGDAFRMALTRDGWYQPWMRLRANEVDEQSRISAMPPFHSVNRVRGIKPGALVLASATVQNGETVPVMVAHRFGKGRAAALLIGDYWRWQLGQQEKTEADLAKAWRQTVRWLVSDVPDRVEFKAQPKRGDPNSATQLTVEIRDEEFQPQDNATVGLEVTSPNGKTFKLTAEPADGQAGVYVASYVPRQPGAFRAVAHARSADGAELGQPQTGWTAEPKADEFRDLRPNVDLLTHIAQRTGGEVLGLDQLNGFVSDLPNRHIEITEPWVYPIWHQGWVFLLAIFFLCSEWGVRRWKGLA